MFTDTGNPGFHISHSVNIIGKGVNPAIPPPVMGKEIVGQAEREDCPVGWGCRILLLCRGIRHPPGYDSDGEIPAVLELCGMLHCHRSRVHSGPEW